MANIHYIYMASKADPTAPVVAYHADWDYTDDAQKFVYSDPQSGSSRIQLSAPIPDGVGPVVAKVLLAQIISPPLRLLKITAAHSSWYQMPLHTIQAENTATHGEEEDDPLRYQYCSVVGVRYLVDDTGAKLDVTLPVYIPNQSFTSAIPPYYSTQWVDDIPMGLAATTSQNFHPDSYPFFLQPGWRWVTELGFVFAKPYIGHTDVEMVAGDIHFFIGDPKPDEGGVYIPKYPGPYDVTYDTCGWAMFIYEGQSPFSSVSANSIRFDKDFIPRRPTQFPVVSVPDRSNDILNEMLLNEMVL